MTRYIVIAAGPQDWRLLDIIAKRDVPFVNGSADGFPTLAAAARCCAAHNRAYREWSK